MSSELAKDADAAIRHARFGSLPEPIRFEDMTQEVPAGPSSVVNAAYDPEGSWQHYSCLAMDLGL
ncbi:hypothetical protein [Actinacidiphila acidipaludis]|uniref:Uncharacterized protein n=1 Tax=Actinacidiphila acidipaludis TaxID=2873382 RepID=A0ABS7QIZ9_9ACTN|nr:hypothetical protein [Streptomyces acidipaludis]MBY8883149.1 hypothetical protein [Streptomyces acidipaludis]